jgi:hypothetical protein
VTYVAVMMLTGNHRLFATSVAAMLMAPQASIFSTIMGRTTSQIRDVRDARSG